MNRLEAFGYIDIETARVNQMLIESKVQLTPEKLITMLTRELGAMSNAILEDKKVELKKELVKLTALSLLWLEQFPNERNDRSGD